MRDMVNNKQVVHLGAVTISGTTPATSAYVDIANQEGGRFFLESLVSSLGGEI